jgi:hypothetical protein
MSVMGTAPAMRLSVVGTGAWRQAGWAFRGVGRGEPAITPAPPLVTHRA